MPPNGQNRVLALRKCLLESYFYSEGRASGEHHACQLDIGGKQAGRKYNLTHVQGLQRALPLLRCVWCNKFYWRRAECAPFDHWHNYGLVTLCSSSHHSGFSFVATRASFTLSRAWPSVR